MPVAAAPTGIDWGELRPEQVQAIPVLRALAATRVGEGGQSRSGPASERSVGIELRCLPYAERISRRGAVVTRLVDGDTFEADVAGRAEQIRMLNIDSPETKDPDKPVECLGPEASERLAELIPVGTSVTLEYDVEHTDRYGRTLAGVLLDDGTLVNAEIARAGLAIAVVIGKNARFFPPVEEAQQEAAAARHGLYSTDVACTLPAQVDSVTRTAAEAPTADGLSGATSADQVDVIASDTAAAALTVAALTQAFAGDRAGLVWAAFTPGEQEAFARRVADAATTVQGKASALRATAASTRAQEQEAARQAQAAESARLAEEQRQERQAAEERQAAKERQAAEERQRVADAERSRSESDVAKRAPTRPNTPSVGDNPYPGYTGPRCYAPGGRTWKPCPR